MRVGKVSWPSLMQIELKYMARFPDSLYEPLIWDLEEASDSPNFQPQWVSLRLGNFEPFSIDISHFKTPYDVHRMHSFVPLQCCFTTLKKKTTFTLKCLRISLVWALSSFNGSELKASFDQSFFSNNITMYWQT